MSDPFSTKDLNEAAYMYLDGNQHFPKSPSDWLSPEKDGVEQTWFYFADTFRRSDQHNLWESRRAMVNLQDFLYARRILLDVVHGGEPKQKR